MFGQPCVAYRMAVINFENLWLDTFKTTEIIGK